MTPFLLVLSSPSGGGKTTIARQLVDAREDLAYSVSATTRAPRGHERDGADYHFLSRAEFDRRIAGGAFLEWAEYGGERYGTLRDPVDGALAAGRSVVLDIEVQGARQIRAARKDTVLVFILPPSAGVLAERLAARGTESPGQIRSRLNKAAEEVAAVGEYDYAVTNADLFTAVAQVSAVIDAEGLRVSRQTGLAESAAELGRELRAEAGKIGGN